MLLSSVIVAVVIFVASVGVVIVVVVDVDSGIVTILLARISNTGVDFAVIMHVLRRNTA